MEIFDFSFTSIILYIFTLLYAIFLISIAIIDRKEIKIDKKFLVYGIILSIFYMVYMYGVRATTIYYSIKYLAFHAILLAVDTFLLRRYAKDSYIVKLLMLLNIIYIFTDQRITTYTIMITLLAMLIYVGSLKIKEFEKKRKTKVKLEEIPMGFFLASSNLIALFVMTFVTNFI